MGKYIPNQYFQAIFCGNPGVGKSKLIASAFFSGKVDPRIGTTLMLEIENKSHSIAPWISQTVSLEELADSNFELDRDKLNIMEHLSVDEIEKVIKMIWAGKGCTNQIETLVVDSLTELDNKVARDAAELQRTTTDKSIKENGFFVYKTATERIPPLIAKMKDIPNINFIGTAHVEKITNKDDAITGLVPMFTGKKLPVNVAGMFPMMAYMTIPLDKEDRSFTTREIVFQESPRKKGLEYIKNQYAGNTLGESILYEEGEPILSMILDGCLIPYPEGTGPSTISSTKTEKTTKGK